MSQQAPVDEREIPGEQEAWHRLHDVIDRITPDIADLALRGAGVSAHEPEWLNAGV